MVFQKQAVGIEMVPGGCRLALINGKADSPCIERYAFGEFSPNVLNLSLKETNVLDPEAFVRTVREAYLLLLARTSRVSVSLPDSVGRVVLLDLDTRFKSRDEGGDVIRWKLKKSLPFDIQEAHLDFQLLQEKPTGEISVLVSLIARQVICQYEDLLAEAGLQPTRIDFTTFNIYRLYEPRFSLAEDYAVVSYRDGILGMLIFSGSDLSFYRAKEIPGEIFNGNRLFREISNSLLVYKEKQDVTPLKEVFCVIPPELRESIASIVSEATGLEPVLLQAERQVSCGQGLTCSPAQFHLLHGAVGAGLRNL